jgi:hypothetical protein
MRRRRGRWTGRFVGFIDGTDEAVWLAWDHDEGGATIIGMWPLCWWLEQPTA